MRNARTFTLVRHGRSTYNDRGLVNGDPLVPVELDDVGREQILALREDLGAREFDLAVRSRFPRTEQSLALLLAGRNVPVVVYPELDDVRLGVFEGRPVSEYREWRRSHSPDEPPPGEGESRVGTLYRYLRGYERLLREDAGAVLVVIHDVPIRFLLNAARGADPLDGPVRAVANAEVNVVDEDALARALAVMRDRVGL